MPDPDELESLLLRSLQFTSKDADLGVNSRGNNWIHRVTSENLKVRHWGPRRTAFWIGVKERTGDTEAANGTCIMFTWFLLPSKQCSDQRSLALLVLVRPLTEHSVLCSLPWKTHWEIKDYPEKPPGHRRDSYEQIRRNWGCSSWRTEAQWGFDDCFQICEGLEKRRLFW